MELWHQYLIHCNRWAPFPGWNGGVEKAEGTILFIYETFAGASEKKQTKKNNQTYKLARVLERDSQRRRQNQ